MKPVAKIPVDSIAERLADRLSIAGIECSFVARSPGRVNLIGEHIDYNGYAVLPMALEQALYIAVGFQDNNRTPVLNLTSTVDEFKPIIIPCSEADKFGDDGPPAQPEWYHYFLCGYRAVQEFAIKKGITWNPRGLHACVGGPDYGNLFIAAGLSSSAAMVVSSAITVMKANNLKIDKRDLATLCAKCERYIGMQSGGMDQAASLLSTVDHAMLIEFTKPCVTSYPVPLPKDVVFVISHTGVYAKKAAQSFYNERVAECRLATHMLLSTKGITPKSSSKVLSDVQKAYRFSNPDDMLNLIDFEGRSVVAQGIRAGVWNRNQLKANSAIKLPVESFLNTNTLKMNSFALRARAEHVYAEAARVYKFYDLCRGVGSGLPVTSDRLIEQLGTLMNESQESCSTLYECSCPEIDELTQICRQGGAIGSRLTGAGWGGCTVSLVYKSNLSSFMQHVKDMYYHPRDIEETDSLLFVSKAGIPAGYMEMKQQ